MNYKSAGPPVLAFYSGFGDFPACVDNRLFQMATVCEVPAPARVPDMKAWRPGAYASPCEGPAGDEAIQQEQSRR